MELVFLVIIIAYGLDIVILVPENLTEPAVVIEVDLSRPAGVILMPIACVLSFAVLVVGDPVTVTAAVLEFALIGQNSVVVKFADSVLHALLVKAAVD